MKYPKKELLEISKKITYGQRISPDDIVFLLSFERKQQESTGISLLKIVALPVSLVIGFFFAAFPDIFDQLSTELPIWTNLSPQMLSGIDYYWDILGEPVGKQNIVFHLPNIVLYSFGILGIKRIIDSLDRKTWLDKVLEAQGILKKSIAAGKVNYQLKKGHSLLFVGKGDFIGMQHALNHQPSDAVTISEKKPSYTNVWCYYDSNALYEDLKEVLLQSDTKDAGEYIFFPVKDDQIFLPNENAYDLSPHKLDILCQNIRNLEKEMRWSQKRIIIIGDKNHKSFVRSEDSKRVIPKSSDIISLITLSKKYNKLTVIDPSDIVLKQIIKIAAGRRIVFRATKGGIKEYKERFYKRLNSLGYKYKAKEKGVLTIGYDIFEDQTEQQTLSRLVDDYLPVVLSKNVKDALIRNGYRSHEFLYVPDLVLNNLAKEALLQ